MEKQIEEVKQQNKELKKQNVEVKEKNDRMENQIEEVKKQNYQQILQYEHDLSSICHPTGIIAKSFDGMEKD